MDEGVFIIVVLVIMLGLIAGLYFVIDLLSQRVFGLASEARGREQHEIVNDERLARKINELVDEMADLTEALKTERILRSHGEAAARVAAKQACAPARLPRDDRATVPMPPPPKVLEHATDAAEDDATRVLERADMPAPPP